MLKYLIFSFIGYFYLLSNTFAATTGNGFLTGVFADMALGFGKLFGNANVVFLFMFIAFFFGVFSLIKNLLKFAFKNHHLGSESKAINVISFMVSFIGTSGIAFMFNSSPKQFVLFFGGIFGMLIMIVFSFLIMQLFINMANSVAPKEGDKRKNAGSFWFIIVLGSLLVAYLILGFSGKVLVEMGCSDPFAHHFGEPSNYVEKNPSYKCDSSTIFSKVFSTVSNVIQIIWSFVVLAAIAGLVWWFLFRDPKVVLKSDMTDSEIENKKELDRAKGVKDLTSNLRSSLKSASKNFEDKTKALKELQQMIGGMK